MSDRTPYAVAKIVNARLAADGVAKKLPPQMFYNYRANGLFTDYTDEGINKWYDKYVARLRERTSA